MALPVIDTPKYMATIPSTGEKVSYRPYLVKEEKILMIALESENQEQILGAVKDIIGACTFNKVNVDELAIFDLEYLFLKLRSKSVGETSRVGLKCSNCETSNEVEIPIDTIEVSGVDKDNGVIMLTDKVGMKLRYPSVKDAEKLTNAKDNVGTIMKTIVMCIENIFDDEKVYPAKDSTPKELEAFIDSLNSEQFKKIQGFFESMPSLSYTTKFKCDSCGHENELVIKGLANFFG
jgi:transcription elongation factor Elf1